MTEKIYILGGGFGGIYSAMELEHRLAGDRDIEITLVNRDNFFLFTPMLHEVAASDLDLTTIINPARKLLRKVQLFAGEVEHIDLPNNRLTLSHGFKRHSHTFSYDRLILALGSITNFYNLPGPRATGAHDEEPGRCGGVAEPSNCPPGGGGYGLCPRSSRAAANIRSGGRGLCGRRNNRCRQRFFAAGAAALPQPE